MRYSLVYSKEFSKALRRYVHAGRNRMVEYIQEVGELLRARDIESILLLKNVWKDHPLKGDKHGMRELHLGMDDLLIYQIDHQTESIEFINIVGHEKLRKRW